VYFLILANLLVPGHGYGTVHIPNTDPDENRIDAICEDPDSETLLKNE
jgi:hypothetical protein